MADPTLKDVLAAIASVAADVKAHRAETDAHRAETAAAFAKLDEELSRHAERRIATSSAISSG